MMERSIFLFIIFDRVCVHTLHNTILAALHVVDLSLE